MKLKATFGLLLISITILAQDNINYEIFSNAHGLKRGTSLYFEVEGYDVFTYDFDNLYFDKTGIKKAKKKFKIEKENLGSVDSIIGVQNKYFVTDYNYTDNINQKSIFYFIPTVNNKIKTIAFSRALDRDIDIERLFVESIINAAIPESVYTQPNTDSVSFAGRNIYLGGACRWMSPHNVQCPDFGQISWATFRTIDEARKSAEINYLITANKGMGEVIEKDSANVVFEGVETTALKTKYKIKIPQLIMGGSNILIIYYVATEVREKYISCVMSQYTDDVNAKGLAPLLQEVMKLTE
jgi:hypothetical protein